MTNPDLSFIHEIVQGRDRQQSLTLLLLHGTGGNERDLIPLGHMLAPDSTLLSPRGKVLERGMPRFFRRLSDGVFDIPDLKARTGELAHFVGKAADVYGLDRRRIFAVGYSNGANIAASMLLLRPRVLAGAVLLHAMVPLVPETAPDLSGTPVFLTAGRMDALVSPEETEQLAAMLREYGGDVELQWEEGGHGLTQCELQGATQWLARHRPDPATYQ